MARYSGHLFTKPLLHGTIDNIGFFAGRFKCLNRLAGDLFMILSPIQVFTVHRVIENILAHTALQAFPRKHTYEFFLQPQPEHQAKNNFADGGARPFAKPDF